MTSRAYLNGATDSQTISVSITGSGCTPFQPAAFLGKRQLGLVLVGTPFLCRMGDIGHFRPPKTASHFGGVGLIGWLRKGLGRGQEGDKQGQLNRFTIAGCANLRSSVWGYND